MSLEFMTSVAMSAKCVGTTTKKTHQALEQRILTPKTGKYRCLRGGSWLYRNGLVYTKRVCNSFEDKPLQSASNVGFRVVRRMQSDTDS